MIKRTSEVGLKLHSNIELLLVVPIIDALGDFLRIAWYRLAWT